MTYIFKPLVWKVATAAFGPPPQWPLVPAWTLIFLALLLGLLSCRN